MHFLNICINGEVAGTTKSQTAPFVPSLSHKVRVDGVSYKVLEVVVEYTKLGTEIFLYIERL